MKTLTWFCNNCKSIISIMIDDDETISNVINVLDKFLSCPKCHTPLGSDDESTGHLTPFNSKLIPTFLELNQKGYVFSIYPGRGDNESMYTRILIDDDTIDLRRGKQFSSHIIESGGFIESRNSIMLPLILDNDAFIDFYAWVLLLKDVYNKNDDMIDHIDTYELWFSDFVKLLK